MGSREVGIRSAADILGVHANTVRNWIASGRLTATPMAGHSGFRRLERREVELLASALRNKLLTCVDCGKVTTPLEARHRHFSTGRCGFCDCELLTQLEMWDARHEVALSEGVSVLGKEQQ